MLPAFLMATAADIVWSDAEDDALAGELGGMRGVIRPRPGYPDYEAWIILPATGVGSPHIIPTVTEAVAWVEQELLRLADSGAV